MPCCLKRGFFTARLQGLWIRSPLRHGDLSIVRVVSCQVEFYATGRSFNQRCPTEWVVPECDGEALIMRRPWLTRADGP